MTFRRVLVVYAALALACAFYPAFFGELPVPVGGGLLLLPDPWVPQARNDELTDVPTQLLPPTKAAADAYRQGRLPFRMAAQGCGEPLWANPVAQCVTPTTLLYLFLPAPWASAAGAAAKLLLAAAGAYLFARGRGLSAVACVWTGLVFGFSLYFTTWMHFPQSWAHAFFPWALAALDRLARGRAGGFRAALLVVLLLLLGGYPEGEFLVALAGALFFFVVLLSERATGRQRWARLGLAAAASLLALGLTAAYTLPATFAIVRGERSVQVTRGTRDLRPSLALRDLLRPPIYWDVARFWIVPEAQGNPRDQDKFGPYSFAGRTGGHAGILVLAFALSTFFWRRPPRFVSWARWGWVLTALYMLWYRPLVYLLQATPGVHEIALRITTNRAAGILILLAAVLAAFELDRIRAGGSTVSTRAAVAIALALTALVTVEYARAAERPPLTAGRAASFVLPALLLVAVFVALAGAKSPRRSRILSALLLVGTGVELLRIGARFNPGTPPEDYFPLTPKVRELQQAAAGGRFASYETTLTGMAYMYGLEDIRVHDATAPADYEDVLAVAAGYTGPAEYNARVTRLDAPFLDFLNVRARLGPRASLTIRNTASLVFPERLVGVKDSGALLARLGAETDFARRAVVIGTDEVFLGSASVASFAKPRPEELRIRARCDAARVLVIPETNDGGWTAEGNGTRLPTLVANGAFLAVRVPAGETEIVCRYIPPGFRTGRMISLACLGILLLIVTGRSLASRRLA